MRTLDNARVTENNPFQVLREAMMNALKVYLAPIVVGMIAAGIGSWSLFASGGGNDNFVSEPTPSPLSPTPESTLGTSETPQEPTPTVQGDTNTLTVNIYHADGGCQTLVAEQMQIPTNNALDATVGEVLEEAYSSDFDLSGYRVNFNQQSGVATIDLRLAPDSQRDFTSLSTCEQFALFGSLRKTLTDNAQLNIKDVQFTEQGKDIYL